jgi:ligand-binding sensor domain-containing protein
MLLDLAQTLPEGIRWRGLRSKVPLSTDDLYGNLGSGQANFPTLLLPSGWMWNPDGTILDPYLRTVLITDWIVDVRGYFWATYWGAGVLFDDLRGGRPDFYQAGPGGNDVRAILVDHDNVWLGGLNSGDRIGITRASPNLKNWQTYETRDNSRIRSTDAVDIASWNGDTWFATDEGLLAFKSKDQSWKLYNINQHLQSDQVTSLAPSDSELWIGTTDGLAVMTLPNRDVYRINNQGAILTDVTRLALCRDTLYVGTSLGLFKGAIKDRHFSYTNLDPSIVNAAVTDISVIASEVWVATANGVLVYDQEDGKSKSFVLTWTGGYVPTTIHAGSQFVWVGTPSGLYRYRRSTGEWISYTTTDGLLDNRVQVVEGFGDDLLVGTASGLTRFYWNRPDRNR